MEIAAIILAAGFSSRMGVSKPLLPVGGVSAVRRCADIARRAGVGAVIVVTGHKGAEVAEDAARGGSVIIADNTRFEDGMYSSIIRGVQALPSGTDGFFMFPVDYCAVRPDTLKSQIRAFGEAGGNATVYTFRDGHRGHPPLIPAALARKMAAYNSEGGLKGFLEPYPAVRIQTDDLGAYLDMDTPDDYAALLTHLGLPIYPDRAACDNLLAKYETPEDIISHGRQVSELAGKIARLMTGARLDMELLESACMLHDIARREPDHAAAGTRLLLREGYPKAAELVKTHMDGPEGAVKDATEIDEAALLFIADKLSRRGRTVPIHGTISELKNRYTPGSTAHTAATERMKRAERMLRVLFETYGFGYDGIM